MAAPRVIGAAFALALAIPLAIGCTDAEVGGADPVSLAAPPAEPLLPDEPPSGLYLESAVTRDVPVPGTIAASPAGTQATVYGARAGAPLTAPMVAALAFYGAPHESGRPVEVGHDDARMGRTGEIVWIAWEIDYYERGGTALYEGVMGRKVSDAQIRKAAEEFDGGEGAELGGRGLRTRVGIEAAGVPAGMRRLYSGRLPTGSLGPGFAGGTSLTWSDRSREAYLWLREVRLDPRTEAAARILAPESTTPVRGGTATVGGDMPPRPPYLGEETAYPRRILLWREGQVIVQADAVGVPDDVITRLAGSLRRADAETLRELRGSIVRYPMDRLRRKLDPPCPLVSRGRTKQAGWGLCLEGTRRGRTILSGAGLDARGGDLYAPPYGFPETAARVLEVQGRRLRPPNGQGANTGFVLYAGRVAAAVHQVRYDPANGSPVTLRLGPRAEGTRWFSLAVRAADRPGRIRAYGSGGDQLASTRIP